MTIIKHSVPLCGNTEQANSNEDTVQGGMAKQSTEFVEARASVYASAR